MIKKKGDQENERDLLNLQMDFLFFFFALNRLGMLSELIRFTFLGFAVRQLPVSSSIPLMIDISLVDP